MKNKKDHILVFSFCCLLLVFFIFSLYSKNSNSIWKKIKALNGAKYVGDKVCISCHEDIQEELIKNYKFSAHQAIKATGKRCESCHGPGSLHADDGDPEKIVNQRLKPSLMSEICLSCHKESKTMLWNGTRHDMNDVSCISCHKIHQSKNIYDARKNKLPSSTRVRKGAHPRSLKAPEKELCYSCHSRLYAKMNLASHHPVQEGKMTCSSCHEVHGGHNMLKNSEREKNDLCLKCHPQYQGPFAFEHEAVVEDCTICHEPHGAIVDNLLKKAEPFLCYQCHSIHTSVRVHKDVQGVAGKRCTYCHPHIHGSNLSPHLGAR